MAQLGTSGSRVGPGAGGIGSSEPPKEEKKKTESQLAIEALELRLAAEAEAHAVTRRRHEVVLGKAHKRMESLESELELAVKHLQRSEEEHHTEIIRLEGEVTRNIQERHKLMERLEQVTVVDDAVRDLYLHIKDRTSEGELTHEQLQNEREVMQGQNVLTVLGALHAQLKMLWAFKVDAEGELRGRAIARAQAASDRNVLFEDQMRKATLEASTAKAEMEKAQAALRSEQKARAQVLEECEQQQQQLLQVHTVLTEEVKGLMEDNERLRASMKTAMEEGRRRDELVLKNKELQSARYFDKMSSTNKLRQQWHEHLLVMGEMENEVKKRDIKLAEKQMVEAHLTEANVVIQSQKRTLDMQHVKKLENKCARLERALADRDKSIKELSNHLASFRGSQALHSTKVRRQYNWGAGVAVAPEEEDPGDPNHPMQKELIDVKAMHKKATANVEKLKDELEKPPFVDQLLYNLRNERMAMRKGSSMTMLAPSRGSALQRSASRAPSKKNNGVISNSMPGLKDALKADRRIQSASPAAREKR